MTMTPEEIKDAIAYSRWESAAKTAEERGLVIVLPGPREAFVDLDSEDDREHFDAAIEKLAEGAKLAWMLRPSPSGEPGHYHAIVRFQFWDKELSAAERVAIQAALGSDRVRETLSILRIWGEEERPTLFFEKPEVAEEIAVETEGWDAGCEFAAAEGEYDIAESMKAVEARILRHPPPAREPRSGPWWVVFDRGAACVEGTEAEARAIAERECGPVREIHALPYPRRPRLGPTTDCPSFCYGGAECLGKSSCPQRRACDD